MGIVKRVNKAVVDVTIRVVVEANVNEKTIDWAIDNFLERALQSTIDKGLYTEGFVAADRVDSKIIHEWEEVDCKG